MGDVCYGEAANSKFKIQNSKFQAHRYKRLALPRGKPGRQANTNTGGYFGRAKRRWYNRIGRK